RHIRHQVHSHGLIEKLAEPLDIPSFALRCSRLIRFVRLPPGGPIADRLCLPVLPYQYMPGQQPLHPCKQCVITRSAPIGQIVGERSKISFRLHRSRFDQSLDLGGKVYGAISRESVIERLYSQPIADKQEPMSSRVPNTKGKHPSKLT